MFQRSEVTRQEHAHPAINVNFGLLRQEHVIIHYYECPISFEADDVCDGLME